MEMVEAIAEVVEASMEAVEASMKCGSFHGNVHLLQ